MKKLATLALTFVMVLMVTSCGNKTAVIEKTVTDFLDAYFKVEYARAAEYCTDDLKADIIRSMENMESLEAGVKEMIVQSTSQAKVEIISVDTESGKDAAIVRYKVILPHFPNGMEYTTSLVKINKGWKINSLGF